MIDFITRFFRREEASKTLAKERLRLVLMSDRVSLAPELFDEMKGEMLSVIRRYLDIDEHALDLHFENLERQFALLASIPVLKVKTRDQVSSWRSDLVLDLPNGEAAAHNGAAANGALPTNGAASTNGASATPKTPRRRRRRRRTNIPPADPDAPPENDAPQ
jgi:cell division topological specificity factor